MSTHGIKTMESWPHTPESGFGDMVQEMDRRIARRLLLELAYELGKRSDDSEEEITRRATELAVFAAAASGMKGYFQLFNTEAADSSNPKTCSIEITSGTVAAWQKDTETQLLALDSGPELLRAAISMAQATSNSLADKNIIDSPEYINAVHDTKVTEKLGTLRKIVEMRVLDVTMTPRAQVGRSRLANVRRIFGS